MRNHRDYRDPPKFNRLKRRTQPGKANGQGFPWTGLLVALLALAAAAFIARDVRSHGSFKASDTARFLAVSMQLLSAATVYSKQVFAWSRTNLPYFCAECARVLRPLAEQGLVKTRMAARFVSKQIVWLVIWLKANKPLFVEWVNANTPDAVYQALEYFTEQSLFVRENYVLPGVAYASEVLQGAWNGQQQ